MSTLRPDDRSSRKRSTSHSRSRSRSRSPAVNLVAPPAPPATSYTMAHHNDSDSDDFDSDDEITMGDYADFPPEERPGYKPPTQKGGVSYAEPMKPTFTAHPQWGYNAPTAVPNINMAAPRNTSGVAPRQPATTGNAGSYQYETIDPSKIRYTSKPVVDPTPPPQVQMPQMQYMQQMPPADRYGQRDQYQPPPPLNAFGGMPTPPPPPGVIPIGPQSIHYGNIPPPPATSKIPKGAVIKEVVPSGMKPPSPPRGGGLRPHGASFGGSDRPNLRAPSPNGRGKKMHRLSVNDMDRPNIQTITPGGRPPASPLLDAYRGTWQQMSPMPSPLMMGRRYEDDDIDDMSLDPRGSRGNLSKRAPSPRRSKKTVTIYNEQAEEDARAIASELSQKSPNFEVLIDILPALSHDQVMELKTEYKRACKIQGRGINIAKHIKLKCHGNFMKICYVTALGRWESEGYWANFWYQSNSARRELLIEALMGRTNTEIRKIKDSFKDKRYNDDLTRCMDKELKADKFRAAVLMALSEQRQEENEQYSIEERNKDIDALYRALHRREGGETAILEIVVMRSDNHLREVLKVYERKNGKNFAKECLKKSGNLVGEIVAHILNGVINRPARDAMLLHHALADLAPASSSPRDSRSEVNPRGSKSDVNGKAEEGSKKKDRYELLISRLVRLHWDKMHFMRVKLEYKDKYGGYLEEDVENYVKVEDFREVCLVMCESAK